jgi:hypothetical protein
MAYLGNTPTTQSFISGTDYFNGTGSQTAFTLTRTVASVNDIEAVVNNVVQQPNDAYNISGTTITFTSAPSAGTNNVYVRYLSTTTQAITPSQNTVSWNTLDANTQQDLGISYKNKIINGAMQIDQRNAGALVNPAVNGTYYLDRWLAVASQSSTFSIGQNAGSVTPPTGFINYLGITSLSATTVGASDQFNIRQYIEGLNVSDLGWGTANAKTVTLSFWVRSSLTGTFGGTLNNADQNRTYVFSYVINSANTWEQKTVTITGDTTGTWLTSNGIGIRILFSLGAGSSVSGAAGSWGSTLYRSVTGATSVVATSGATWQVTGVQLEVGTQATTFTTAGGSYGAELALCQRYFQRTSFDTGDYPFASVYAYANNTAAGYLPLAVPMRATPTAAILVNMGLRGGGLASQTLISLGGISYSNGIGSGVTVLCNPTTSGTSLTTATVYVLCNQGSGGFTLSAEL